MPYKLYTDKNELFTADISVKNASLKNSLARVVVESEGLNLIFKGKLENGKCTVPIRKLKGLLDENTKGKMHLEVIVEDTFFKPWESDFIVEEHTSVKVAVKEQKEISGKPIVEVKVKDTKRQKLSTPAQELVHICEIFGVNSKNYRTKKRSDFKEVIKEYFKVNKEFAPQMVSILNEVVRHLV